MLLFALAAASIGSASIFVRLSMASPTACAFWRLFIASLLLVTFSRRVEVASLKKVAYPLIAGVALAAHFVLWMDSLFRVPVAVSTVIVVSYPIYLVAVELARGEKPRVTKVAGMAMGFLGVAILSMSVLESGAQASIIGVAESFIASIMVAVYFYTGRATRNAMKLGDYLLLTYSTASVVVLAYSFIIGDNVFSYLPRSWPWLLALAVVPMMGGHTTMNYLLRFYKASTVTSISLTEPITASILAAIILGEVLRPIHAAALLLAVAGLTLVVREEL